MRAAPGFQKLTMPARSVAMIASEAVARIALARSGWYFISPAAGISAASFGTVPLAKNLGRLAALYK
jgi:hypothetical protein